MDVLNTTITVVEQIYTITVFIRGIVNDVRSYESDKEDIQKQLQHEFIFVDVFKSNFIDNEVGREHYRHQTAALRNDVHTTLTRLRGILGEYGIEAAKHGLLNEVGSSSSEAIDAPSHQSMLEDRNSTGALKVPDKDLQIRIRRVYRNAVASAKDFKTKAFDWSLFDKAKLLKTLALYSAWTERLRQTMSLMLSTMRFAESGRGSLKTFEESQGAKDMGLQSVAKRQLLARAVVPDDFVALDGTILEETEPTDALTIQIAEYNDDWSEPRKFVVEYREYGRALDHAIDLDDERAIQELKSPVRKLAWLLHNASFPDFGDEQTSYISGGIPTILSLKCAGYLDQPDRSRWAFLYELPILRPATWLHSPTLTLHALIDATGSGAETGGRKPPLGSRFFVAYALAMTILNIHASGWVHKDIRSQGIIVFHSNALQGFSTPHRFVPYLANWGYARPTVSDTEMTPDVDIEANLYRHPLRQQQPARPFTTEHDYYALGVVLIEIALWSPVSSIFKEQITKGMRQDRPMPVDLLRKRWSHVLREEVEAQMGEAYAEAVNRCIIDTSFHVDHRDEGDPCITFRDLVVEPLRKGTKL